MSGGEKYTCPGCGATFMTPWPNCPICYAPMGSGAPGSPPAPDPTPASGPPKFNLSFGGGSPLSPSAPAPEPMIAPGRPAEQAPAAPAFGGMNFGGGSSSPPTPSPRPPAPAEEAPAEGGSKGPPKFTGMSFGAPNPAPAPAVPAPAAPARPSPAPRAEAPPPVLPAPAAPSPSELGGGKSGKKSSLEDLLQGIKHPEGSGIGSPRAGIDLTKPEGSSLSTGRTAAGQPKVRAEGDPPSSIGGSSIQSDPHAPPPVPEDHTEVHPTAADEPYRGFGALLAVGLVFLLMIGLTLGAIYFGVSQLAAMKKTKGTGTEAASTGNAPEGTGGGTAETSTADLPQPTAPAPAATAGTRPSGTRPAAGASSTEKRPAGTGAPIEPGGAPPASSALDYSVWEGLESKDPATAEASMKRIAAEGRAAVPKLTDTLFAGGSTGRTWAARTVAAIGPDAEPAAEALVRNLARGGPEATAMTAALKSIGSPAIPKLLPALRSPGDIRPVEVQLSVLEILGTRGADAAPAVPILLPLLDAPHPEVRRHSKEVLKSIGPETMPQLLKAWDQASPQAKRALAEVWANYGEKAAEGCEKLQAALEGDTEELHRQAAFTLFRIGGKAVPYLLNSLEKTKSQRARKEISAAVGWIGAPAVAPTIERIESTLKKSDPGSIDQACYLLEALGRTGAAGKPALDKLGQWANLPDPNISYYARHALDLIQRAAR